MTEIEDTEDQPAPRTSNADHVTRTSWPANIGDDELQHASTLLERLHPVTFSRGQLIFAEGDPGDRVYVIRSGTVKIKRRGKGGRENLIALAGPGDVVGELSVFDPGPRSNTVIAVTDVAAGWLDRTTLRTSAAESPEIREELLQILARQLKRRQSELTDLAGADVTGRVARQLLHLAARFGAVEGGAVRVTPRVNDDELADLAGTSGHTLRRILQEFENHGWIRVEGAAFEVLDRRALERTSSEPAAPTHRDQRRTQGSGGAAIRDSQV